MKGAKMLPSKEVLLDTPLHLLKNAMTSRVDTPEEERLLEEIIKQKEIASPLQREVYRGDVPMQIRTPQEEAEIQKTLDDRKEILRGTLQRISPTGQIEPLLKEDLSKEPEVKRFCQFCDSKGFRHKLNCTRKGVV